MDDTNYMTNQPTMTSSEIRRRFLAFFEKRGHAIIPSAPLVPENDPSVLFNTAGMQPLVPYLLGEPHPLGTRLADLQKCVRTVDIDEVGDNTHLTFFEMMGNWSLGDYFKKDAIEWSFELLTNKEEGFGLDPRRLYVTCFEGDENVGRDDESADIWRELFKKAGITSEHIYFLGADSNWWPAVKKGHDSWSGPTGPCTEMFYDVTGKFTEGLTKEEYLKVEGEQKLVEIWNDVFMEYKKQDGKIMGKLDKKNVDTGSGFERVVMVLQGKTNLYETDIFTNIFAKIDEFVSDKTAKDLGENAARSKRIIADHMRSAVMTISDGVEPSNTDRGYILRRLIRRAVRHADALGMKSGSLFWLADCIIDGYKDVYTNIGKQKETIKVTIDKEEQKFRNTLNNGLKEFSKAAEKDKESGVISGKDAFTLFSTYGFPIELTEEMAKEKNLKVDKDAFAKEMLEHQDLSRAGAGEKFKGGLGDTSEMSVRYHTATHLLHQALREVLGEHVSQKGSNITPERLRFDFSHPTKMTDDEKKRVEDIVNKKIADALPVQVVSLPKEEAARTGALHFFGEKYGDVVTVYYIGDTVDEAFSKEFCGGPHVKNTSELGHFKIQKEEAVAQGVRRIKGVLE